MANRPSAEVDVDVDLARRLLRSQASDYADRELTPLSRGWDNTNLRLGPDLIVRIPHRREAAPLMVNEQRWLPELAQQVTLPVPAPIISGTPDHGVGYPWHWSIVPWFEGHEAAGATLQDPAHSAELLGRFFRSLHVEGPSHPPTNPYRGQPLAALREPLEHRLGQLGDQWNTDHIRAVFEDAEATPAANESVWLHGDMHLRNLVVNDGALSAVIDWGDMCTGDRATDLAAAYMLVPEHIDVVCDHAGADDAAWARARGWAVHFAVMYLVMSDDEPIQRSIGENLLRVLVH